MQVFRKGILVVAFGLAAVFAFEGMIQAADYPSKPVQIIVGFPPGAVTDLAARTLAKAAESFFPQPFFVVNKPGGASVLGSNEVVRAVPNGYTLGALTATAFTSTTHLTKNPPYKGPEDILPVIHLLRQAIILTVRADAPYKTMKELVEYAKANPGKLRFGNAGIGMGTHFHMESLIAQGVPARTIPFTGGAPAVAALLGGHIEGLSLNIMPPLPHVRSGKLRYVAIFADERYTADPALADVPTLKELGYNVLTEGSDYFIGAPKDTPKEIVNMLYNTFLKAEKTDFFQKFAKENFCYMNYKGTEGLKKEYDESYKFYKEFIPKLGLI